MLAAAHPPVPFRPALPLVIAMLLCAAPGGRLVAPAIAESRPPEAALNAIFDMRKGYVSTAPEAIACGSEGRDTAYAWFDGMVRDQCCRGPNQPSEYIEGHDATFVIAIDPPDALCDVRITLGDPAEARGPVRVTVNAHRAGAPVTTAAGEFREIRAIRRARSGRISVRLQTADCRGFAVRTIAVKTSEPARFGLLFPTPPDRDPVPAPETLTAQSTRSSRALLRRMCDFLVANSPREGSFSYSGAWYQNAYPVRTLLAASRILGERRYREAAFLCLDAFVKCQGPGGNWLSAYFAAPGCESEPADSASSNLADIGTMSACLAMAAQWAEDPRQEVYLAAATKYADNVSLPAQLPDGAFPNGRWGGVEFAHPYTIATATQALSLACLFNATGDVKYLDSAEKAAWWLVSNTFLDDGRIAIYPHDRAERMVIAPHYFGEMFYVTDALIQVRGSTADDSLRTAIDSSIREWLVGPNGIQAYSIHGYWWMPQDAWSSSKMGGMLFVLANHPHLMQDLKVRRWLDNALAWMADPECAQQIGVMANPASSRGQYALPATGFAGIGVAASLDPLALSVMPPAVAQRLNR